MAAEHVIPFPQECSRHETCMQSERIADQAAQIAVLRQRADNGKTQLDRIEDKVDAIKNWLLGAVLSLAIALIGAIVVAVLKK